jgi:RimJ/RimL family protein N-acetyltransferase
VPTLVTQRLRLRDWRDDDLPAFRALNADPEVMRHLPGPLDAAASDALAARAREALARQGWGSWAVELPGEVSFIGMVGLGHVRFVAPFAPAIEVGWRLARTCWGRGYATEAARVVIDFAFTNLAVSELVSFTVPGNAASRRVMEKLGFRLDEPAGFSHPHLPPGHPLARHVLYRLSHEAWVTSRRLP